MDKDFRPLQGDFLTTLFVELTPAAGLSALPVNLGILLDVSSSMAGPKLESSKRACQLILAELSETDCASVVAFSNTPHVLVPGQAMTASAKQQAQAAVAGVEEEGATVLNTGLEAVYQEVSRFAGPERNTFVVMISDGVPTDDTGYPLNDLNPFIERANREQAERGVSLTTIGLGSAEDYDAPFLRELADRGNGQFLYSPNAEELMGKFREAHKHIAGAVVSDATLYFSEFGGTLRRVWRVLPDKKLFDVPAVQGGSFAVPIGSLRAGEPQGFLLDLVTSADPGQRPGKEVLCQIEARYIMEGDARKAGATVLLNYSDNELELAQRNREVIRLNQEAVDFLMQRDLEEAVRRGDKRAQTMLLQRKRRLTMRLGKTAATKMLDDMASKLDSGGQISQDDLVLSSQETKKTKRLG